MLSAYFFTTVSKTLGGEFGLDAGASVSANTRTRSSQRLVGEAMTGKLRPLIFAVFLCAYFELGPTRRYDVVLSV